MTFSSWCSRYSAWRCVEVPAVARRSGEVLPAFASASCACRSRLQHLAAQYIASSRWSIWRIVRGAVGSYGRHRQPGTSSFPHRSMRWLMAGLGGSGTLVGGAIGTLSCSGSRVLSTLVPVVALRFGRRLCRDDSLSADRADGHSGAACVRDGRNRANKKRRDIGTRVLLKARQHGSRTMTSTLLRGSVRFC